MSTNLSFDIINDYNKKPDAQFDPRELVNLFIDTDPLGKNGKAAFSTPALNLAINFGGDGKGRAAYRFKDTLYVVVKNTIYSIDTALNRSFVGNINTEEGYVGIESNVTQIIFVDGVDGWILDTITNGFSIISSPGFPSQPVDIAVLAERFLVNSENSQEIHYSAPNDGTNWDPLDKFNITAYPDVVVGLKTLRGRLFVMGKRSTEIWYDAGTPTIPFARASVLEFGCIGVGTISADFGVLIWLTETSRGTGSVVITSGTQAIPISNKAIEQEFNTYINPQDARSFIYKNESAHIMYQINFTADNKSWCYDLTEKRWSNLEYKAKDRHLAEAHVYFQEKHYVLDYSQPKMYELSQKFHSDDEINIRRALVTPILFDKNYREMILNKVVIDLRRGIGNESGESSDPKLFLSVSYNGGISYGNQIQETIGKIGEFWWRVEFWELGRSPFFNFLIEYYDKTPFILLGMSVNISLVEEIS